MADLPPPFVLPQEQSTGGMFGGNKTKTALLAALAGFMARKSPQVSSTLLGNIQDQQELKQRLAIAQQQHQQQMQDQMALYDYKRQNPEAPDITQRIAALNEITPGLGDTYAKNYAANGGGSPIQFVDPATGQRYMMPQSQAQLPPIGSVVPDPRKAGGPASPAPAMFP
jgi:hypothetical protein